MADASSELTAEIAKLEQKHAETPGGRYFVPLANAYRKVGDFGRAEALLHEGLRRHPDYLSAHIVLGRCYTDRGAHDSAVEEFRHVLSLDPQNLIALRTLGELATARGRGDDAAHWYRELLAVDPMNDEARAALDELAEHAAGGAGEAETTPLDDEATTQPEPAVRLDEPLDIDVDAPLGGWEPSEDLDAFYVETLDLGEPEPVESARPAEAAGSAEPVAEPGPREADGFDPVDFTFSDEAALELPAPEEVEAVEAERGADTDADGGPPAEPGPDADEASLDAFDSDAGEVVTRTIADLYARQGLYDRAASVYRELIQRAGGHDAELEERLAEVEQRARAELDLPMVAAEPDDAAADHDARDDSAPAEPQADAFAASFAYGFAGESGTAVAADGAVELEIPETAVEPDEQQPRTAVMPIAAYLADLLAWTPAGVEPPAVEDTPDEAPRVVLDSPPADDFEPLPWELPLPSAGLEGEDADAFSFDAFFAEPAAEPAAAAEPAPAAEYAADGGGDDEGEDLESFQAWLRSLKR